MSPKRRIRTIGGSGGGSTAAGSATVRIGPDFGTTNQKVEQHLSLAVQRGVYSMTEELSLHPTTYLQTYNTLTEELHVSAAQRQTYPTLSEELHVGPAVLEPVYPMTEELHVGPETQRQTYPTLTEELHVSGSVTGPPQFESATNVSSSNSTAVAFTGITTVIGTFLLASMGANVGSSTLSAPVGWTEILNSTNVVGTTAASLASWWRVIAAADPSSWTFRQPVGAAGIVLGTILQFSAVDNTAPINASAASTGNSTVLLAPSVTATKPNVMCLALGMQTDAVAAPAYTAVSPYVQRVAQTGARAAVNAGQEACTHVAATSGATGTATINTGELTGGTWITHMIAINSTNRVIA